MSDILFLTSLRKCIQIFISLVPEKWLIERQKSWNYGHIDFKQCISCNNAIQLQEFNIIIFVVLYVHVFTFWTFFPAKRGSAWVVKTADSGVLKTHARRAVL
jgi:hypothetical protein